MSVCPTCDGTGQPHSTGLASFVKGTQGFVNPGNWCCLMCNGSGEWGEAPELSTWSPPPMGDPLRRRVIVRGVVVGMARAAFHFEAVHRVWEDS